MSDLVTNALVRKLAAAERAGDEARARLIRARLASLADDAEPVPEPAPATPEPKRRGRPKKKAADPTPEPEPPVADVWTEQLEPAEVPEEETF